jgi:hypothetical protein
MSRPSSLAAVLVLVALAACRSPEPGAPATTSAPVRPAAPAPAPPGPAARPGAATPAPAPAAARARVLRVYVAGESIERRNHWVAPPFLANGALNARGGGAATNDDEEYGWVVPFVDRLRLRAPEITVELVGADRWLDGDDNPYSGTYPSTTPGATSAISGTSIDAWLEQRRGELGAKRQCYDVAFAARGGNDFGNDDDGAFKAQLKELVGLLAAGSRCRKDPIVVVTGHLPDDQRGGGPPADAAYVAQQKHRFVARARAAVDELRAERPAVRARFVDLYTPFVENRPTTAFPAPAFSRGGVPDFALIGRTGDRMHPRRLASIYAGELAADALDLAELRALP